MTMRDKVVLVSGANSGIGYETTKGLAALGAHVIMVCRDGTKCQEARGSIEDAVPGASLETMLVDLCSQGDIRRFASEFKASHDRLDVLFNNAGGIPNERKETVDGIEWQLAVNHLAPFLMTHLLMDVLMASTPSHVVTTSSGMYPRGKVDMDDLQARRRYRPMNRYATTKLMNILFTRSLAQRLEGTGVRANCLSPGMVDTGLSRDYGPMMRWLVRRIAKPQEEGGKTPVCVMSAPELQDVSGAYFRNMERRDVSVKARDDQLAEALWRESERLVGLTAEEKAAMPAGPPVPSGTR
jgi:NAD(P)-dependent dehydrogenase (short-subunit alcohol dehydrogenase family)